MEQIQSRNNWLAKIRYFKDPFSDHSFFIYAHYIFEENRPPQSNISSEPHLLGGDLLGETVEFSLQTRHFLGEGSEEKLGPGQQLWARDN